MGKAEILLCRVDSIPRYAAHFPELFLVKMAPQEAISPSFTSSVQLSESRAAPLLSSSPGALMRPSPGRAGRKGGRTRKPGKIAAGSERAGLPA